MAVVQCLCNLHPGKTDKNPAACHLYIDMGEWGDTGPWGPGEGGGKELYADIVRISLMPDS
jgi:hypothetical protein